MAKQFSDRTIRALKPAKPGTRHYDEWDPGFPGFGVRVSESGTKTFVLMARYRGRNPARRSLGRYAPLSPAEHGWAVEAFKALPDGHQQTFDEFLLGRYGATTLGAARARAKQWKAQIERGVDPAEVAAEHRNAQTRARQNTFGAAVEQYLQKQVVGPNSEKPRQRNASEVAKDLGIFAKLWADRPITKIGRDEIIDFLEDVRDLGTANALAKRGHGKAGKPKPAPGRGRNLLSYLKTFFGWVLDAPRFHLPASPAERIKPAKLFGERSPTGRALSDAEIFAFMRATSRLRYPAGPAYRLLLLTGLRLNEVAGARWREFDLAKKLWIVPAARMKGKNGRARPHAVPLTAEMLALLDGLPRFNGGDNLFSVTSGKSPIGMGDKIKKRIDRRMALTLRALARKRGENPTKVHLEPWVNHDLRHTVRTNLTAMGINGDVAEAILAHAKPGIRGVYDHHEFLPEKRTALEKWSARMRDSSEPPPANVVKLSKARA